MKLTETALLIPLLALIASGPTVSAEPDRGVVRVEHEVPPAAKTGEEVTTELTFRALADIDQLDVSVAPFKGLELVSEQKTAAFTAMKKGEGRQMTVTIRLTDPKFGYLAITYRTRQGQKSGGGATTVVYTNSGQ